MTDDDQDTWLNRHRLAAQAALPLFEPFLDALVGMVALVERRGFTTEQARAIVAFQFGYRPADPRELGEEP